MIQISSKNLIVSTILIILTFILTSCSSPKPVVIQENKVDYALLHGLQGQPNSEQRPIVKFNNNVMLSKTLRLPSGQHAIEIKYYDNSARPIIQQLNFLTKAGYCYQLVFRQGSYHIDPQGLCLSPSK